MTEEEFEEVWDKDHVVLKYIEKGLDDVQKITAETTLENHHVSYCSEKLEDLGLITVERPDRMVEWIIDDQKRVFQRPKEAKLTGKAHRYLEQLELGSMTEYESLNHREVVEQVETVEDELEELKGSFRLFRKQIQKKI